MSGEEGDSDAASKPGMCNREIVRRGALILFCDYVVSRETRGVVGQGQLLRSHLLPPSHQLGDHRTVDRSERWVLLRLVAEERFVCRSRASGTWSACLCDRNEPRV